MKMLPTYALAFCWGAYSGAVVERPIHSGIVAVVGAVGIWALFTLISEVRGRQ